MDTDVGTAGKGHLFNAPGQGRSWIWLESRKQTQKGQIFGAFLMPAVTLKGLSAIQAPLRPGTESPLISRAIHGTFCSHSQSLCDKQDSVIPSHPAGEQGRTLPILARKEKGNRVVFLGKQCQRPGDPTLSTSNAKATPA